MQKTHKSTRVVYNEHQKIKQKRDDINILPPSTKA